MKPGYTQGQWRADIDSIAGGVHEESMREFDKAYKPEHQYWSVHAWRGSAGHYVAETGCHAESEANARLIAAAPAMLKELELAYIALLQMPLVGYEWRHVHQHIYAGIRDVLAEALGEDAEAVQNHYEAIVRGEA